MIICPNCNIEAKNITNTNVIINCLHCGNKFNPSFHKGCTQNNKGPYFTTWSGIKFNVLEPTIDMINIIDIAHSLSIMRRFGGHLNVGYSIGIHSLYVEDLVEYKYKKRARMHDGSEAYMPDLMTPLKRHPSFQGAVRYEDNLQGLIFESVGLPRIDEEADAAIKEADLAMLYFEVKQLSNHDWWKNIPVPNFPEPKIVIPSDAEVEKIFLSRMEKHL